MRILRWKDFGRKKTDFGHPYGLIDGTSSKRAPLLWPCAGNFALSSSQVPAESDLKAKRTKTGSRRSRVDRVRDLGLLGNYLGYESYGAALEGTVTVALPGVVFSPLPFSSQISQSIRY